MSGMSGICNLRLELQLCKPTCKKRLTETSFGMGLASHGCQAIRFQDTLINVPWVNEGSF